MLPHTALQATLDLQHRIIYDFQREPFVTQGAFNAAQLCKADVGALTVQRARLDRVCKLLVSAGILDDSDGLSVRGQKNMNTCTESEKQFGRPSSRSPSSVNITGIAVATKVAQEEGKCAENVAVESILRAEEIASKLADIDQRSTSTAASCDRLERERAEDIRRVETNSARILRLAGVMEKLVADKAASGIFANTTPVKHPKLIGKEAGVGLTGKPIDVQPIAKASTEDSLSINTLGCVQERHGHGRVEFFSPVNSAGDEEYHTNKAGEDKLDNNVMVTSAHVDFEEVDTATPARAPLLSNSADNCTADVSNTNNRDVSVEANATAENHQRTGNRGEEDSEADLVTNVKEETQKVGGAQPSSFIPPLSDATDDGITSTFVIPCCPEMPHNRSKDNEEKETNSQSSVYAPSGDEGVHEAEGGNDCVATIAVSISHASMPVQPQVDRPRAEDATPRTWPRSSWSSLTTVSSDACSRIDRGQPITNSNTCLRREHSLPIITPLGPDFGRSRAAPMSTPGASNTPFNTTYVAPEEVLDSQSLRVHSSIERVPHRPTSRSTNGRAAACDLREGGQKSVGLDSSKETVVANVTTHPRKNTASAGIHRRGPKTSTKSSMMDTRRARSFKGVTRGGGITPRALEAYIARSDIRCAASVSQSETVAEGFGAGPPSRGARLAALEGTPKLWCPRDTWEYHVITSPSVESSSMGVFAEDSVVAGPLSVSTATPRTVAEETGASVP